MNQIEEQSANASSSVTENVSERELVEQHGVGQMRGPRERAERPDEPAIPAVRVREGVRVVLVTRGERGQGAEALALGGRRLDPPGELGQRPALRPARDVVGSKSARASSQNGLGSRGEPSSVADSRTRYRRREGRVHAV